MRGCWARRRCAKAPAGHAGRGVVDSVLTLTAAIVQDVLPPVKFELRVWRAQAEGIPSPGLRAQAVSSAELKAFHCAGGGVYGLLAGERREAAMRFIVAYQTIADYLDNLCDRSTSQDPDDFRLLHTSMLHALTPGAGPDHYYRWRQGQDDRGYLANLVATCQKVLSDLPEYDVIAPHLLELADYYCALQVHKHIQPAKRVQAMQAWSAEHMVALPDMAWHEFSACSGSTLGIFALVASACRGGCDAKLARDLKNAHFPWVQGLHILLDYLIDQDEDRRTGELNFCACYRDEAEMTARLAHFYRQANASIAGLPHAGFHRLINQGLLGVYGSDPKVRGQEHVKESIRRLILDAGATARFFHCGCQFHRHLAPRGLLNGS